MTSRQKLPAQMQCNAQYKFNAVMFEASLKLVLNMWQPYLSGIVLLLANLNSAFGLLPSPHECGKLNLTQFYNATDIADPTEYPWIAKIGYSEFDEIHVTALAVLISRRYLLGAAQSFEDTHHPAEFAILGDSSLSNPTKPVYCNRQEGDCMHVPAVYELEEVAIHPNFDSRRKTNDLAVLRTKRDVTFNDYISPICLPPPDPSGNLYAGQFLPFVGFAMRNLKNYRVKILLHVMNTQQCQQLTQNYKFEMSDHYFCGIPNSPVILLTGSALMGVKLLNGVPNSFYLIGYVTSGPLQPGTDIPDVFTRVSKNLEWINENLVK